MTYRIKHGTYNIDIRLENGLYRVSGFSSTGKSRLTQLLKDCRDFGYNVFSIDASGIKALKESGGKIPQGKHVYMFDRYDLYREEFHSEIIKLSKTSIVLLDTKLRKTLSKEMKLCIPIMMNSESIIVAGGEV